MKTVFFLGATHTLDWRYLLWPIGSLCILALLIYGGIWLWHQKDTKQQPLIFLFEQILWSFRKPLAILCLSSTLLITLGFTAGSQVSMILYVALSTLTVVGLGAMAWWMWPKNSAEGNLFDLIPLPHLEWPAFENKRDHMMRAWVEHRVREIKSDPPDFSGAVFGSIALEISQEAAEIYNKETPLSVSVDDLLQGVERTASDLKILTHHLPLAGHYTLAEIERQVEFAVERGRWLYAALFLVLSFFNPGNLIRVGLAFVQQKSPWEHLLKELQGWIYGHYTERLGYHMSLIHSQRKPPSSDELRESIAKQRQQRDESIRNQKLGWLALLGLFGFGLYLILQWVNVALVFGIPGGLIGLLLLVGCVYGVWGLRDPSHWTELWNAIVPKWSSTPPPEGPRELTARKNMALVLREYRTPPDIQDLQEAKELPGLYGRLFLELWEACYSAYRPEQETDASRSTREFYLPQAFAGIEDLCHALHLWFSSSSILPRSMRQFERMGFNLETLYNYLQTPTDDSISEPPENTHDLEAQEEAIEEAPVHPVMGWLNRMGKSIGNAIKNLAIKQLHEAILKEFTDEIGERFLLIYGARYTQDVFEKPSEHPENEVQAVLFLSREWSTHSEILHHLLLQESEHLERSEQTETVELCGPYGQLSTKDGASLLFDAYPLPMKIEDTECLEMLQTAILHRKYKRIVLVDTIDYGAKKRIRESIDSILTPMLRTSDVGRMALVVGGIEKLKPLRWDPPYDDYLSEQPSKRRSQRIRNAILAWSKALDGVHAMDAIYPVAIEPQEGIETWGLPSLRTYIGIPECNKATEEPDGSLKDAEEDSLPTSTSEHPESKHVEESVSVSVETTEQSEVDTACNPSSVPATELDVSPKSQEAQDTSSTESLEQKETL